MDRTVGNYALLLALLFWSTAYSGVQLKLKDTEGRSITTIAVGQPFQIEVLVNDVAGNPSIPTLEHDAQIQSQRTGKRTSIINGRSSHAFTYHAQANGMGAYKVGPAFVSIGSTRYTADPVPLTVGERTVHTNPMPRNNYQAPVELQLITDKKEVVVGEKVNCVLRLYTDDTSIGVSQAIGQPKLNSCNVTTVETPQARLDPNGQRCIEWHWTLYPHKVGTQTIPAHSVDYEAPRYENEIWWGMRSLLGPRMERKRVYSNSTQLTINPLPAEAADAQLVGSLDTIEAAITPAVAKQGEGMILSITLRGREGFDQLEQFPLSGIPEELLFYESNKSTDYTDGNYKEGSRTFDFVIQGTEPGSWSIPAQKLIYFDTTDQRRKELQTTPLLVTVTPGIVPPPQVVTQPPEGMSEEQTEQADEKPFCPLNEDGPYNSTGTQPQLPWLLFFVLLMVPVSWLIYGLINQFWRSYWQRNATRIKARRAFATARAELQKENALRSTYQIVRQCIADRIGRPEQTLTHNEIEYLLIEAGLSDDQLAAWHDFLNQSAQQAFGVPSATEATKLRRQTLEWLDLLQKVL